MLILFMTRQNTNVLGMSAGSSKVQMEERFREAASRLGYTGRVAPFPKEHPRNEKVANFLTWVMKHLNDANLVSTNDIVRSCDF